MTTIKKMYECCNCGHLFDSKHIVRIIKYLYGIGRYNQFSQDMRIDLCEECYNDLLYDLIEIRLRKEDSDNEGWQ